MTYPDAGDFAKLQERVKELEASRRVVLKSFYFWFPCIGALVLLLVGVEAYHRIPSQAAKIVIDKKGEDIHKEVDTYKSKIFSELDDSLKDVLQVNDDVRQVKKSVFEKQGEIEEILKQATLDAGALPRAQVRLRGFGVFEERKTSLCEVGGNRMCAEGEEESDGFVMARLGYTETSAHHGYVGGYLFDSEGRRTLVAANEFSRNSAGSASIMMPVKAGTRWEVRTVVSGAGTAPELTVYWMPVGSGYGSLPSPGAGSSSDG